MAVLRMTRRPKISAPAKREAVPAGPAPDRARLHEAALKHLSRYATTEVGLRRVLFRRVDRWARAAGGDSADAAAAKQAAREVVARLVEQGLVSDAAFAAARARSLTRAGRSRRAVEAHLAQRGVGAEVLRETVAEDAETELAAALAMTRRRRIGPFRAAELEDGVEAAAARLKELGVLARAGFSQDIARQALGMELEEAQARIARLRRD